MTHNMQDKSFSIGSLKGEDGDVYGRYYGSDGEEGGYQVMSEDITSLRDGLSGLEGNLYGERNVLSKQSSKLENTSGVGPITKKSHSHVKRIDGQTPKLKGEEGDASDKYYGLKGQEGGYIGILEDITSLRDGFSGLDGDPNGKDNILSSHGSESEVVGKISPKVKGLHKDLKKMNGQTKRLKDQKGGSQVVFGGRSILKGKLKGKEGDFDGQSDVLSGRTKGPKNQKDKSLGISGFGSYIKGKLSGLEGNSYGQPDVLKGKTHGLPGKEGELSGQKGEPQVALGGYSGLSRLKGDEGDSYDQSDGLSGKTLGLPGQDSVSLGVSPGISRAQPDLRDKLSGLEGDINGQHNVLGSKSSEFEITGGITPKMNISYDSMKGESGQAQILKYEEDGFNSQYDVLSGRTKGLPGQKGESQAVLGGSSGLRSSLKGEEGNSYGQPDVLKGKTHGLSGQEGELRDKIHGLPDQKGELQVALGGYSGLSRLKGSEGDSYDQSDGLKGKTLGLKGQEGVSPGISRAHPNLKDKLSGLEGDLSGQHNVLSSKSSEFEITGGISPKINMSYD
ncbi:CIR protein, partial [Plasmodium chabaudi chabaudi]